MFFSAQNKADIIKYFKARKSVLLHNDLQKNIFNRVHLIQKIHKKVTGCKQLDLVEFIKTEDIPTKEQLIKDLGEKLNKALIDEYSRRNKKTASHGNAKTDSEATDSSVDILGDMGVLLEFDMFRIDAESILIQWQNQTPKNQLIVEIENKVREHFKSTTKSFYEKDFADDKGKDVYSFLMQKQVVDNIEILHDPVLNKPFFSVPIYESFLLDFNGTIFLNNLECDPGCREDDDHYLEIVKIINQKPSCWLVAYTDNVEYFSREFTAPDGFKSIRLKGKKVKGRNGQTNAMKGLSKDLEFIRWDDDEKFYAKAKGKTADRLLELKGQSFQIFHCLFNEYDNNTKKASVAIDTVLQEAGIKGHKKGDNISKNKKDHLSSKITPIKDELEKAGFDGGRIKLINDRCELYIDCSYHD